MGLTVLVALCAAATASNAAARAGLATSSRAGALEVMSSELTSAKDTPVQRVVRLLQEMKAQLEKEADADSSTYDKLVCWCEKNEEAKTKAVADADAKISDLVAEVGTRGGKEGELGAKVAQLKKDLAAQKEALAQATALREKEHAAFDAEEKEMVQAISLLKNAIAVLSRHHSGLLQMTPAVQESLGSALRWASLKHEEMLALSTRGLQLPTASAKASATSLLSTVERALRSDTTAGTAAEEAVLRALRGAVARPSKGLPVEYAARVLASAAVQAASFAQQPSHLQPYAPQSGEIFGILKQMQEEFEASLSQAQKEELQAQEAFTQLRSASEEQITASAATLDELETDRSENVKALSDAKEDLAATREARAADVTFLSDLRLKCQALDHDWKKRSQGRAEELKAVSEAIAILTEEDARDLFHKKMGTGASLLQQRMESSTRRKARSQAAELLLRVAGGMHQEPDVAELYKAWHSSEEQPHEQLAAMAVRVQLDAFTKVKQAIDDMVQELKQQQEEEVKHKAGCTKELDDNEKMTYETKEDLEDVKDKISSLEETIQKMEEGIAVAKKEIARMEVEIKKAGEVREEENKNFQEEVTDQRAMQNIIKKAIARLRMVYKQTEALAQQSAEPAPPVNFQPYKQNAGSQSVISLMEAIVQDSAALEAEAVTAEQEAQQAYESMVKDSNESIKRLNEEIAEKTDTKAASEVEKEEAQAHQQSTESKLQDLMDYKADLHAQCDFVLKNFEIRQRARLQEIEALQGAKAFLSGMSTDDE